MSEVDTWIEDEEKISSSSCTKTCVSMIKKTGNWIKQQTREGECRIFMSAIIFIRERICIQSATAGSVFLFCFHSIETSI